MARPRGDDVHFFLKGAGEPLYRRKAGITKKAGPRSPRRTFAARKAEKGVSPCQLRGWPGRNALAATQICAHRPGERAQGQGGSQPQSPYECLGERESGPLPSWPATRGLPSGLRPARKPTLILYKGDAPSAVEGMMKASVLFGSLRRDGETPPEAER
jgi:hypothetical protein